MHTKALTYALERDLRKDRFVFRRTASALISMLKSSSVTLKELDTMENLLLSKADFTDEGLMEQQLEHLFGQTSDNHLYAVNLEQGIKLLEAIRNKKEALRPPFIAKS